MYRKKNTRTRTVLVFFSEKGMNIFAKVCRDMQGYILSIAISKIEKY